MLEIFILIFREHVLEFVVEIFLAILEVDLKGVAVERISVRISQLLSLQHAVLGFFVGLYHPKIFCHLPSIDRDCLIVNDASFHTSK
jgi:hypothetical protein